MGTILFEQLNLRIDNVYKCLFDELFRPTAWMQRQFREEIRRLSDGKRSDNGLAALAGLHVDEDVIAALPPAPAPDHLRILIQIRAGDDAIKQQDRWTKAALSDDDLVSKAEALLPEALLNFFRCAEYIEGDGWAKGKASRVTWYIMTDHLGVRRYARARYPERALVRVGEVFHTGWPDHQTETKGFRSAVGEWWLGGLADAFCITATSGLGSQAAFRSGRMQQVYRLATELTGPDSARLVGSDFASRRIEAANLGREYSEV